MSRSFAGAQYWCVGLADAKTEIYLHADTVSVNAEGLIFFCKTATINSPPVSRMALALAPGEWRYVYAASVLDGHAIDVEHWAGQILEDQ